MSTLCTVHPVKACRGSGSVAPFIPILGTQVCLCFVLQGELSEPQSSRQTKYLAVCELWTMFSVQFMGIVIIRLHKEFSIRRDKQ